MYDRVVKVVCAMQLNYKGRKLFIKHVIFMNKKHTGVL